MLLVSVFARLIPLVRRILDGHGYSTVFIIFRYQYGPMPSSSSIFIRARDTIYSGRLKHLIDATGANKFLGALYRHLFAATRGNTLPISAGTATAQITVPTSRIDNLHTFEGGDEHDFLRMLLNELEHDDVVADIGAHHGIFAAVLADAISPDHVIAVEPHPHNLEYVHTNAPGVHHAPVALSDSQGEMELGTPTRNPGGSTFTLAASEDEGDGDVVDVTTGDQLFREVGQHPTVMKLDVEGAELQAIRGMRETLTHPDFRALFLEVHRPGGQNASLADFGASRDELVEELAELGFELETVQERDDVWRTEHLIARR